MDWSCPVRDDLAALRAEHDLLIRQMRLAEQVQRSLLPHPLPTPPGVRFGAGYRPTQHMAGDFFSVFRLDRERVGFYVGDVMGHGPAAALLSVFAMSAFRPKRVEVNSYEILSPAAVLERLSRTLIESDLPDQPFLTMVYGVLDTQNRTWTYCCGGHPQPLLLREGAPPTLLDETGPLLGVIDLPFSERQVALQPGDRLVLYSDGVLTAEWGGTVRPGLDGLADALGQRDGRSVQDLIDEAVAHVAFEHAMADDIAILTAELLPPPTAPATP